MDQKNNTMVEKWDNKLKNCYVYLHYTADTNQLFYVGIGTHDLIQYHSKYTRANTTHKNARNYLWTRYYSKHGRKVVIYKDNLTEKEAKETEIFLIEKYGRLINKSGILCNISAGGEGRFKDNSNNKKVYVYNLAGKFLMTFSSCKDAAAFLMLERRNISAAANMKRLTCGDYQFRYEYNKDKDIKNLATSQKKIARPIKCTNIETGEILRFDSVYKFTKYLQLSSNSHILEVLANKRNNVKKWKVQYEL